LKENLFKLDFAMRLKTAGLKIYSTNISPLC
jgi:hypothetical protein